MVHPSFQTNHFWDGIPRGPCKGRNPAGRSHIMRAMVTPFVGVMAREPLQGGRNPRVSGLITMPAVDGLNPAPLGNHGKPLCIGICRGIIIPGFLRWCRISPILSNNPKQRPFLTMAHVGAQGVQGRSRVLVPGHFFDRVQMSTRGRALMRCSCAEKPKLMSKSQQEL